MRMHLFCSHEKDFKIHLFPSLGHAYTAYPRLFKFSDFVPFGENLCLSFFKKLLGQFFVVVLFIILLHVVLSLSSSVKILVYDLPNKSYQAVLSQNTNLLQSHKTNFSSLKICYTTPLKKEIVQL